MRFISRIYLFSLALTLSFIACTQGLAADTPILRFGVIADPQYAPVAPQGSRYYGNSLWKLSEAIADLNAEDLSFVVTLGDIIDRHAESFTHIMPIYQRLKHDHYSVLGNHEFAVEDDYKLTIPLFLRLQSRYYDFSVADIRFIVLDGNDLSLVGRQEGSAERAAAEAMLKELIEAGAVNAKGWNGGLSEAQLVWLDQRLTAAEEAGERVIVLCHFPVYPANEYNLWNADVVLDTLAGYDNVIAYLNGHNHAGHYGTRDGIHYITFEGMVETPTETAYAIIEVYASQLAIEGFGRVPDRNLAIPALR